jgi:glycosyltransferase involved in cell wall biosynthesis
MQMAACHKRSGHEVEVLTMDGPDAPWIERLPMKCHAMGPGLLSYGYAARLDPWLRKSHRDFDVVMVNGMWQYNSYGVWHALRDTGTPYLLYPHGMLDPWFKRQYRLKHLKKWLYWRWREFRVLKDALAVVFTSEEERRVSRETFGLYHCNERVMSLGISSPGGDCNGQRRAFHEAFPHLEGKRILLFLGRVHEKKGCDLLLRALATSLEEPGDCTDLGLGRIHLVMGGPDDNAYAARLKGLAEGLGLSQRVTWTGMLSGDLKWGAFRAADAFVLPSHQENFGIAVVEALACGVPVLISNRVNIWREIETYRAGLVEADDLAGTSGLLKKWIQMPPDEWAEMKGNAVQCFERCFDIERVAPSLIEMLHTLGVPGAREHNGVSVEAGKT